MDALRAYVLHRAFPSQFKFAHSAQLVDRGAILVPAGYDSFELVDQSLLGSQPRWASDKPFEKMVPAPHPEDTEDPAALLAADIRVDSHDRWLEKLEKAAGAGLEELQKQSVEASKKAEAAAAARRAAADRRKREEKDVSSKHLANFFNNLLSRPEKSKSSRAIGDQKKVRAYDSHEKRASTMSVCARVDLELTPSSVVGRRRRRRTSRTWRSRSSRASRSAPRLLRTPECW